MNAYAWFTSYLEVQGWAKYGEFKHSRAVSLDIRDLKDQHFYLGTRAIQDDEVIDFMNDMEISIYSATRNIAAVDLFKYQFSDWLSDYKESFIRGLDFFPRSNFIDGVTQAIDNWYVLNKDRRIRIFRGEWIYNVQQLEANDFHWCYIEDDDLKENDCVLISLPFSGTGNTHPLHEETLRICDRKGIPVMLDCCFAPVSNTRIDLDYDCIKVAAFSLTKLFPTIHLPCGIRFIKEGQEDFVTVKESRKQYNRLSATIGSHLITRFPYDHIYKRYRKIQKKYCEKFNLEPADILLYGIGREEDLHKYPGFRHWLTYSDNVELSHYAPMFSLVSLLENDSLLSKYEKEIQECLTSSKL